MKIARLLVGLSLVFLFIGSPLSAALRLEFHLEGETFRDGRSTYSWKGRRVMFIDNTRVISETKDQTIVLDTVRGEMVLIYHSEKIFETAKLPFRYEDYANEQKKKDLAVITAFMPDNVEITESPEITRIGAWQARKVHVEALAPAAEVRYEMDLWLSSVPGVNFEVYDIFSRNLYAMELYARAWAHRVIELEGMAVREEKTREVSNVKMVTVSELISFEEVALPVEKLRPSEDYREVPFELSRHFGYTGSPAATLEQASKSE